MFRSGACGIPMCLRTEPTNRSGLVNGTMMLKRASEAPGHHRPSLRAVHRQSEWRQHPVWRSLFGNEVVAVADSALHLQSVYARSCEESIGIECSSTPIPTATLDSCCESSTLSTLQRPQDPQNRPHLTQYATQIHLYWPSLLTETHLMQHWPVAQAIEEPT